MREELYHKPAGNGLSAIVMGLTVLLGSASLAAAAAESGDAMEIVQAELLSERGSTRATRYASTNKIVTIRGKAHIAWLDSISNTMIATYDHASGQWEQPVKVGSGTDNHGGPALTCDSQSYLHIIFGPHGDVPFQHCRSARPNDASKWIKLDTFGHRPTYPSAVFDKDDSLNVIYRGGVSSGARKLMYQQRTRDGVWSEPRALARAPADWTSYTHYHASIAIAANQTLHVAFDLYFAGAAKHAGHMTSRDRGKTWEAADGSLLDLPVSVGSPALFASTDEAFKVVNVVCDSASRPWVSLADARSKAGPTIYRHDGKRWSSFCPARSLVSGIRVSELSFTGSLSIDTQDGIYIALTRGSRVVGGISGDVILLYSSDRGTSFRHLDVFPPDAQLPHTGLSLERPTGHNVVEIPWLLFSTGEKGPDCFGKGIFHRVHAVQFRKTP